MLFCESSQRYFVIPNLNVFIEEIHSEQGTTTCANSQKVK